LKILFITAWYPTKQNPVSGIFIQEHAKAVAVFGDEIIIIHSERGKTHTKGPYEFSDTLENGIRTIRISYFHSPFRLINYLIYLWSILKVSQKLIRGGFRPEVIHAHIYSAGVPAVIIGRLYGIPVVISEHWSGFPLRELTLMEKTMARFAMNHAQWILPVSHNLQKGIEAYGIRGRFKVIPNVVDTALFYPRKNDQKDIDKKRILFVGLLNPIKGMPYLFKALAQLRKKQYDWQLDIVGDGPARMEYEHLVADMGLADKVIFHGFRSKKEVAGFMRKADLFVLPSLFETFSIVTAEALATGIPVLATSCGGPEEFITNDVGLIVPPGDTEALSNGLDYMLNHLRNYASGQISLYATERFGFERIGKQLHTIYSACAIEHGGGNENASRAETNYLEHEQVPILIDQ
jgi:glycosyltransferase involved in cell wall biosynthesis